jgi:hypothetical protein
MYQLVATQEHLLRILFNGMLGQQGPLWLFLDIFTNIFTKILNIQEDLKVEEKPIYYNSLIVT